MKLFFKINEINRKKLLGLNFYLKNIFRRNIFNIIVFLIFFCIYLNIKYVFYIVEKFIMLRVSLFE